MKKIINKIKNIKFGIIYGLVIGVIITSCISYGVNNITSSSVSYTKDGSTISVKDELDNLIIKVNENGKGYTLPQKVLSINYKVTSNDLKSYVNKYIELVEDMGDPLVDITELTAIKNGTITWSSKDTSIVEINGSNITGKKKDKTILIGTVSTGQVVSIPVEVKEGIYLSDVVSIGDYVAYDAGSWKSSKDKPTSSCWTNDSTGASCFGGYTSGQNKGKSVSWCYSSSNTTSLEGWKVLAKDTNTKTVTLVHAGHPECYYHASGGHSEQTITNLNNRATSTYMNSSYATSAHMMTLNEVYADTKNILRSIGDFYWLEYFADNSYMFRVGPNGVATTENSTNSSFGIRPVIVLKSNILTTGKGTDYVGQSNAWQLVKP